MKGKHRNPATPEDEDKVDELEENDD